MARKVYARRYSQAVFEIALETKQLDRWQSDLRRLASLAGDSDIVAFLENPKVPADKKTGLLSESLGDVEPLALNLVHLLMARGKLGMIADIADEYQRLLDGYRGIEPAEVTTAVPLDKADEQRLAEQLSVLTGKKIVIKTKVDPRVIGGITARVGGKLIDGSTRSKLVALKRELARAR